MSRLTKAAKALLADISTFSTLVVRLPLRKYQVEPLRAILTSIFAKQGLEFLLIFPRQSGKNEAVAQLLVYLLNIYQRIGGNIIYGAISIGRELGIERLEDRLDNPWNAGKWTTKRKPARRILGRACITFLSTHPAAKTRTIRSSPLQISAGRIGARHPRQGPPRPTAWQKAKHTHHRNTLQGMPDPGAWPMPTAPPQQCNSATVQQ